MIGNMAEAYYWLRDWFWNEYFWLPPSAGWADLQRNETTFYPDANDMFIPIPMAVGLFVVRLLWERYNALFHSRLDLTAFLSNVAFCIFYVLTLIQTLTKTL